MSTLVFVMPDGSDEISGGNLYNAQLLAALKSCGHVLRMSVSEFASSDLPRGTYLVDTLNLDVAQGVLERRSAGQRFVLLVHHLPSLEPGLAPDHPSLAVEGAVLGKFDGYVATGEFTRTWLAECGISERVELLEPPMPANADVVRTISAPLRALMVCNLIPRKGVLAFLKGLEGELAARHVGERFHLDIVGRSDLHREYGEECARIVRESASLRKHVTLRGPLPHGELPTEYCGANLFLSASKMETFGISLQEARHYGLPILAVRGGNTENHVHQGRTGNLYDSPEALAQGFVQLLRDSDEHARMFALAQSMRPRGGERWVGSVERLKQSLARWFS